MSGAEDPPVEEPAHVASGRRFDRADEIDRLDVAHRVVGDVGAQRAAHALPAELAAQHVQHRAALLIKVAVEKLDWILEHVVHDRAPVALAVFAQIRIDHLVNLVEILIPATIGFCKNRLEIRGETLVEPRVRPITTGDEIAEPLMR